MSRALVILAAEDDAEIARAAHGARGVAGVPVCGRRPSASRQSLRRQTPKAPRQNVAERLDALPEARAIGEIGLDYHYDFSPRDVQHAVFRVADPAGARAAICRS